MTNYSLLFVLVIRRKGASKGVMNDKIKQVVKYVQVYTEKTACSD